MQFRGCGQDSEVAICAKCSPTQDGWRNICKSCNLSCRLQYCVPCYVNFKLNRRCKQCEKVCEKKWCEDCYQKFVRPCEKCSRATDSNRFCESCSDIRNTCEGCGGRKKPGFRKTCFGCTKYQWLPCKVCTAPTPLFEICLRCSDAHCKRCFKPSDRTYCKSCYRDPLKCNTCDVFIYPMFLRCLECARGDATKFAPINQQTTQKDSQTEDDNKVTSASEKTEITQVTGKVAETNALQETVAEHATKTEQNSIDDFEDVVVVATMV